MGFLHRIALLFIDHIFKTDKIATNMEELTKLRPKGFENQCAIWLRKKGYKTYKARYGEKVYTYTGRTKFISDHYQWYILVKDQSGDEIGLGKCKCAKAGSNKKDVDKLIVSLNKYGYEKGWLFSLYDHPQVVSKYINSVTSHDIVLVPGKDII